MEVMLVTLPTPVGTVNIVLLTFAPLFLRSRRARGGSLVKLRVVYFTRGNVIVSRVRAARPCARRPAT